jgi:hypothetical protein
VLTGKRCLIERLNRCDREISQAIEESRRPHSEAKHVVILIWEMDWLGERELRQFRSLRAARSGSIFHKVSQ